ncbi:capsule biosynthesis protein CapA [Maritimibacter sp. 55A14]|uniref:capsule biosynthesis protein n=1 Tax=Maritimibacter sp. 55A14 TaxID=2174844 RepID=UPI000D6119C1|nr:capsule biosynthesis protein CapA [Maritimibacter sp. 55A14]PWE33400.1 capsule biosynthesis protein CapA [Maritimibacter sp. 55A14]
MGMVSGAGRSFLFLQGPHGPFFDQLGRMLLSAGARVHRVGFNRGDQVFWRDHASYTPFTGRPDEWPAALRALLTRHGVTDLVLYGDTRPVHAAAVQGARQAGITVHCFEEGYLRPYWVTYERGGVNGHSRLMDMPVAQMQAQLRGRDLDLPDAPPRWGDMRQHVFYGALYHFHVLTRNRRYANFRPHRSLTVAQEFRLYLLRLLAIPRHALQRTIATRRIKQGGFAYHLVLLQLGHDASVQSHSPFTSMTGFVDICLEGFARGAPTHHHLVIKAHPLEDGRQPLRREAMRKARALGIAERVHFVRGGKLAALLDQARSCVTINSTAAQQALWRGVPVRAFGRAVYCKPEFLSDQPLEEFFADPDLPDTRAYRSYRHYLMETSQVQGGFYSARGRRQLLRRVTDMLLAEHDPYDALFRGDAAPAQQLRVVR